MAKAAVRRRGCHGDRLLSEADTQGGVAVPVCVTALLSDLHHLLQGERVLLWFLLPPSALVTTLTIRGHLVPPDV